MRRSIAERLRIPSALGWWRDVPGWAEWAQEELVVCHQDFHGGNVLRAAREPWLVIC